MLFNSYEFIFYYLPIVFIVYYFIKKYCNHKISVLIIIIASLFYYCWWNPIYLLLLGFSIVFNYSFGNLIAKTYLSGRDLKNNNKFYLTIGVVTNVLLLAYFKYFGFFIDNIKYFTGFDIYFNRVVLPLAISFFTFQQIAFLVDAYFGEAKEYNFFNYCLFVTFFPQLIAGPIVHHKEMMPQFEKLENKTINNKNLSIGIIFFTIGLFKKVIIADNMAAFANPVFISAEQNNIITFFEAWGGALSYNFQIYFDFSGYCDMAIGLGKLFGITIPTNFNSPYKANNIIEFWRRWHMTLSRFLRDYIYIPLGGNRKGKLKRYVNLMITMLLGGLWHGASWTFVFWGTLHGIYLIINHSFISIRKYLNYDIERRTAIGVYVSRFITFIAVIIAWVFFRAESFKGSFQIISGMFGLNGFNLDYRLAPYLPYSHGWIEFEGYHMGTFLNWGMPFLLILWFVVWSLPNTQELVKKFKISFDSSNQGGEKSNMEKISWKTIIVKSVIIAILFLYAIINIDNNNEFIYYQF